MTVRNKGANVIRGIVQYIFCLVSVLKKFFLYVLKDNTTYKQVMSELREPTQVVVYPGCILYIVCVLEKSPLRVPKYSIILYVWTGVRK
jgi:hypothetical protein